MATYAIGDVQGCFVTLQRLLARIAFDAARDRLLFAGDLVNRGPRSLDVLRFARDLGERATVVLGNHDLFLLALAQGSVGPRRRTTLDDVLAAPDRDELCAWLGRQPFFHRERDFVLVHAGIHPTWSIARAERLAAELAAGTTPDLVARFVAGGAPQWSERLQGDERLAAIAATLTTLRACTPEGVRDDEYSGPLATLPDGTFPWFALRRWFEESETILFGHWAAMGFARGEGYVALDSGCVWGGTLTAFRLDDGLAFHEPMAD